MIKKEEECVYQANTYSNISIHLAIKLSIEKWSWFDIKGGAGSTSLLTENVGETKTKRSQDYQKIGGVHSLGFS